MLLTFQKEDRQPDDYAVISGDSRVGRIYKRTSTANPKSQWLWALNAVRDTELGRLRLAGVTLHGLRLAGMTATLDEAQAELSENWSNWLAITQTQKIGDPNTPPPPASQQGSPDSST
jgi:hypothetical protein